MFDFLVIFTKGGFVLWCIERTANVIVPTVNAFISSSLLQERSGNETFEHESISLRYKLDNEFGLVFVLGFHKVLQLVYAEKFITDIHKLFCSKFKKALSEAKFFQEFPFELEYRNMLTCAELSHAVSSMRDFVDSSKSQKTVGSLLIGSTSEKSMLSKKQKKRKKNKPNPLPTVDAKYPQNWGDNGKTVAKLDRGAMKEEDTNSIIDASKFLSRDANLSSELIQGEICNIEKDETTDEENVSSGIMSYFNKLVLGHKLSTRELRPSMDLLERHLISKNVAADVASMLCCSVTKQLIGQTVGTFQTIYGIVYQALIDALIQILSPTRRLDILRDIEEIKQRREPYVIVFCGVNGVGKSTNLAKVAFWLIENNYRVLIAAGDTFRAGAVEQLRTHVRHLTSIHPPQNHDGKQMIQLFERGYGKDPATIAKEAICYATDNNIHVVLVDTAGRMQNNQPLMMSLAKVITTNNPALVLFVGEALVGNDAVDQLMKFNEALADYSSLEQPHLLDGILLTKFDTIDNKVGAAVSMSYLTGQPIVFVGTGQTYTDLRTLDAKTVVQSLMK